MRTSPITFTTQFVVKHQTLVIDLGKPHRILSSAPHNGGWIRAQYILNHQVPANTRCDSLGAPTCPANPSRYLRQTAAEYGIRRPCVALMTAVCLSDLVTLREVRGDLWLEAFVTVGVSNAVRAGEPIEEQLQGSHLAPGTINIILRSNARLSAPAMVEVVQVAAESKAATLLAHTIRSCTGRPGATGTGTDATVIIAGEGPRLRYSGTHTNMGAMVGSVVSRAVGEGLKRYQN